MTCSWGSAGGSTSRQSFVFRPSAAVITTDRLAGAIVNISAKYPPEEEKPSSAEASKTGDAISASPVSPGVQVAMALKAAGEAGQVRGRALAATCVDFHNAPHFTNTADTQAIRSSQPKRICFALGTVEGSILSRIIPPCRCHRTFLSASRYSLSAGFLWCLGLLLEFGRRCFTVHSSKK